MVKSLGPRGRETGVGSHSELFLPNDQNSGESGGQLVLFDMPAPAPIKRGGRPSWNKAEEYQELVEAMCDFDASLAQIEAAVGVSAPTLRRIFYRLPAWRKWSLRRRNWRNEDEPASNDLGG